MFSLFFKHLRKYSKSESFNMLFWEKHITKVAIGRSRRPKKMAVPKAFAKFQENILAKLFKNGPSKIYRRQLWKKLKADYITSNLLKAVFHKFYLVHSWIRCPLCDRVTASVVEGFRKHLWYFLMNFVQLLKNKLLIKYLLEVPPYVQ